MSANPIPAVPEAVALDAQGRIAQDLPCVCCGYNLRTLLPEGQCPECGTAVGRSMRGDLLRFSEPTWVETIASGMKWIIIGIIIGFGAGVLVVVPLAAATGHKVLIMLPGLVSSLVALVGYWKVTTPEPRQLELEQGITARKLVRFGFVTSYAFSFAQAAMTTQYATLSQVVGLPGTVFGLIGTIAVFVYAARLAVRIPDLKLARNTRIVMWGIIWAMVGVLMMAGLGILMVVAAGPGGAGAAPVAIGFAALGCIFGVVALVFGIWSIVLLVQYRTAFAKAATEARETWARPEVTTGFPPPVRE